MPVRKTNQRKQIEDVLKSVGLHRGIQASSAIIAPKGTRAAEDGEQNGFRWILTTEPAAVVFDWDRWDFVEEVLLRDGIVIPGNKQVSSPTISSQF